MIRIRVFTLALALSVPTVASAQPESRAAQAAIDVGYILEGMTHTPAGPRHVAAMFARPEVDTGSVLRAANFAPF